MNQRTEVLPIYIVTKAVFVLEPGFVGKRSFPLPQLGKPGLVVQAWAYDSSPSTWPRKSVGVGVTYESLDRIQIELQTPLQHGGEIVVAG
jgi:hypothetical protein